MEALSATVVVGGLGIETTISTTTTSATTSRDGIALGKKKQPLHENCTFSFVDNTIHDHFHDSEHHHLLDPDQHLSVTGLGSLGVAMALAFASGSFSTSPCFTGYCDCMEAGTDWLLLGSLAYQCYFFWTAATRNGARGAVARRG